MSQENVEIVREAFESFLRGNQEMTAQLVDPEVEFHGTVGGLQEGQIAHGQSEIDQTFESEDLEAWEERRLEAEEFIDAGDAVVVPWPPVLPHNLWESKESALAAPICLGSARGLELGAGWRRPARRGTRADHD
jgi:hypothetical protein